MDLSGRQTFPGKVEGSRRDVRRGGEKGIVTCMKRMGVGEEKSPELSMRVDGYCLVIVGEGHNNVLIV